MEERMDCFSLVPLSTVMRGRSDRRATPVGAAPPDRPGGDRAASRAAALGGAPSGATGRNAMGLGKRGGKGGGEGVRGNPACLGRGRGRVSGRAGGGREAVETYAQFGQRRRQSPRGGAISEA